jgi:streptogrisin C
MTTISPARAMTVFGAAVASLGLLTTTASAAGVGDGGDNAVAAAMSAYQAAYPRISDTQARLAAGGSDARRAVYDGAARDPATYGGSWFDPVAGVAHVAATTDGALTRDAELGRRYGVIVQPYKVQRTVAALEAEADRLRAGEGEIGRAAAGQIGIDVKTNEVVAAVPEVRVAGLAGTREGVRVIADPGLKTEEDAGCSSRFTCDVTIRSGAVIVAGTVRCSAGFTARIPSTPPQRVTFTAGHCARGGSTVWTTGAEPIGPELIAIDSGSFDVTALQVTNPWFAGDIGGQIYINGVSGNWVPVVKVAPTLSYIVAGETVCLSANISDPNAGNPCGVVGTNSDAARRGMVRVNGVDGCHGDSGGGWYWLPASGNRQAYGLHSNSDEGCHGDEGGSRSWFTSMPTVKSLLPQYDVETR